MIYNSFNRLYLHEKSGKSVHLTLPFFIITFHDYRIRYQIFITRMYQLYQVTYRQPDVID